MPVKLSQRPSLYQIPTTLEQIEADLEMYSNPKDYVQDDPELILRKKELMQILHPTLPPQVP